MSVAGTFNRQLLGGVVARRWGARNWLVLLPLMGLMISTGGLASVAVANVATTPSATPDQIPGADVENPQRINGRFGHVLAENVPRAHR